MKKHFVNTAFGGYEGRVHESPTTFAQVASRT
jgi:hypothetical protein